MDAGNRSFGGASRHDLRARRQGRLVDGARSSSCLRTTGVGERVLAAKGRVRMPSRTHDNCRYQPTTSRARRRLPRDSCGRPPVAGLTFVNAGSCGRSILPGTRVTTLLPAPFRLGLRQHRVARTADDLPDRVDKAAVSTRGRESMANLVHCAHGRVLGGDGRRTSRCGGRSGPLQGTSVVEPDARSPHLWLPGKPVRKAAVPGRPAEQGQQGQAAPSGGQVLVHRFPAERACDQGKQAAA